MNLLQEAEEKAAGEPPMEFLRRYAPRRWRVPATHYDPRLLWLHGEAITKLITDYEAPDLQQDHTMILSMAVSCALAEHQVPTYFVSDDLCRALARTDPPPYMRLSELTWAHDAMLFCLPRQFCLDYFSVHIPMVACAKLEKGRVYELQKPSGLPPHRVHCPPNDDMFASWVCAFEENGELVGDYSHHCPINIGNETLASMMLTELKHHTFLYPTRFDERDVPIINGATKMILHFLLLMSAVPEMAGEVRCALPAQTVGKHESKRVVKPALFHPRWLGEHYRLPRAQHQGGHHASPTMHWRAGHWRHQRVGPARAESKVIWIRPTLVAAEKECAT